MQVRDEGFEGDPRQKLCDAEESDYIACHDKTSSTLATIDIGSDVKLARCTMAVRDESTDKGDGPEKQLTILRLCKQLQRPKHRGDMYVALLLQ